jgi:hypothetical protein
LESPRRNKMRRAANVLTALALSLPIVVSVGCDHVKAEMYKAAIERALHEDALTGKEPTVAHANAMRSVDMQNCPSEFREAYMKHVHAWDEKAAVHDAKLKVDNDAGGAALAGILADMFDSKETPWSDHLQAEQELQKYDAIASADVTSTWRLVEEIASKYGARVPH